MRALACPASLKGVLTAAEAAAALGEGLRAVGAEATELPIADGGEGTAEALWLALGGEWLEADVHDAFGEPRRAQWLVLTDGSAVVEAAAAIPLDPERLDPLAASSRGFGELVAAAIAAEPAALLLALGGTATMDAGVGFLEVVRDLPVPARVACDVSATLLEAPRVFGPQKGAGLEEVAELERRFAARDELVLIQHKLGGGAAGGLGAALASLGAELVPGAALVLDLLHFDVAGYDLVVTGEGRVDATTALGKAPGEVVRRSAGVRCVVFGGRIEAELPGARDGCPLGRPAVCAPRPCRAGTRPSVESTLSSCVGLAQLVRERLDELPRDPRVGLDDGAELPERHRVGGQIRICGDRCRARALVDQRDLAEVVAWAERAALLAADGHLGRALADDEEAGAALALRRDRVAGGVMSLLEGLGDPVQVARLQPGEQGHLGKRLCRRAGHDAILTGVGLRRKRCGVRRALGELLDRPLGRLEPGEAEAQQLLTPLPELDRLVEPGIAALEALDDLFQLPLRRLEGELAHPRMSSTRAPKPPSASSISTRSPASRPDVPRRTASPARTIA